MLFYTWMIKNHLKDNSAKGLLARSMKAEGNGFPKRRRLKTLVGYAFRCFLLRLGFIGSEYKAERKILLKNLSGSSAFKNGGAGHAVSE